MTNPQVCPVHEPHDPACGETELCPSPTEYVFQMPGMLFWRTDAEGNVIGLSIQPIDSVTICQIPEPGVLSYPFAMSENSPRYLDADRVMVKADEKGWMFPALGDLPDGVEWVC